MSNSSQESLASVFRNYIHRSGSPLMRLDPNQPKSPVKSPNAVANARQVVESLSSTTDASKLPLVSSAFQCLYLSSESGDAELVKKHFRFVVHLNASKLYAFTLPELSTLYTVLDSGRGCRSFTEVEWQTLLRGVAVNDAYPVPLVVSFHFFVMQSLLQSVSTNLSSVVRGGHSIDASVFWRVAQAFLSDSNFSVALARSDHSQLRKYRCNAVKLLAGFLKIAEFVLQKKDSPELCNAVTAFRLKVLEFSALNDETVTAPTFSSLAPEVLPFARDLTSAISGKGVTSKLAAIISPQPAPANLIDVLGELSQGYKDSSTIQLTLALSCQNPSEEVVSQLNEFVSQLRDDLSLLHYVPIILQFLGSQSLHDSGTPIIQKTISGIERMLESENRDQCLETLVPKLGQFLANSRQLTHMKSLTRLCFLHGKNTGYAGALLQAGKLDVVYFQLDADASQAEKVKNRVEYCISALIDTNAYQPAVNLTKQYSETLSLSGLSSNFSSIVASLIRHDKTNKSLFFGKGSLLSSQLQQDLLSSVVPLLEDQGCICSDFLADLGMKMPLSALARLEEKAPLPGAFDTAKIESPSDYIFAAEIMAKNLSDGDASSSANVVFEYAYKWITWLSSQMSEKEHSSFYGAIEILHRLGYIDLAISLISAYQSSKAKCSKTSFECSMMLCQCHLDKGDIEQMPQALRNAGAELKSCHENNSRQMTSNDIAEWKLLQLAYFVEMNDETKSTEKAQEIKLIFERPEYDMSNTTTNIPLNNRLQGLYLLAKYSHVAARINELSASFLTSVQNLKLSIKLLSTIMKKTESRAGFGELRQKTIILLLHCHRTSFMLAKHLGLPRDALHHLRQIMKAKELLRNPSDYVFNSFYASIFFLEANDKAQALIEFKKGVAARKIQNSPALELVEYFASTGLSSAAPAPQKVISLTRTCIKSYEMSNPSVNIVPSGMMRDFFMELDYVFGNPQNDMGVPENSKAKMMNSAIQMARNSLQDFYKSESNALSGFNKSISILPGRLWAGTSGQVEKLFQCKEILMRLEREENHSHLGLAKANDINQLLARCVFLLSSFTSLKEDGAGDLFRALFFYKDRASLMPYQSQRGALMQELDSSLRNLSPVISRKPLEPWSQNGFYEDVQSHLPVDWSVVTIDICDYSGDLILSKLETNASHPIIMRVPFDRKHESTQSFKELSSSLKQIIAESNESTKAHVTSKVRTKEDRRNWWKLRFNLDSRLKNQLLDLEAHTIGGLKGFFETVTTDPGFSKFSKSLNEIWESAFKNLPSTFGLNESLAGLFFSLKRYATNESSSDLIDLINITSEVVKSSRNGIIYQLKSSKWISAQILALYEQHQCTPGTKHLVLIPSFTCTEIPWESMSFLRGRSVSRMPSVSLLLEALKANKTSKVHNGSEKMYYNLNPGNDLMKTQERFESVFQAIPTASGLAGITPSEESMICNILSTNLYVYLGHGGGEQYMRASSLLKAFVEKKRDRLPTALLMGCSSSAFQNNGKLEPTSNVFNWLVGGAPAIVSNLWDVTDKDIDILSLSLFSKWGVAGEVGTTQNLSQALAESRDSCTLKYLNGAAPILHGLPLNLR